MIVKPKVLIVDDEEIVRTNIERILEPMSYQIQTAQNGRQALDIVQKNSDFDLVLTDLIMEDIDGLRLLEEIKRISPETVVIIITGYGSLSSAVQAMQKGAFDYIMKPCGKDELILRVKKGVQKRETDIKMLEVNKMETILANIGMFLLNSKGVVTTANPAMSKKLWGDLHVLGQNFTDLPGILQANLVSCLKQAVSGEDACKEDVKFYSPVNKKDFILSCYLKPIVFKDGKPKSIMLIIEDLTRRTKIMQ